MIGIVAHDAGAAEFLSSYLRRHEFDYMCCLEGAAVGTFARKLGDVESHTLKTVLEHCDWLLCGTSYLSDLEWRATQECKIMGKRVVAVIDHWVNYRQRFFRHGKWCFPDEVWVGDETALRIAKSELPEVVVSLVDNPYYRDVLAELDAIEVAPRTEGGGARILYVCEPVREDCLACYGDERFLGYTEEDALRYFLTNVASTGIDIDKITIRPHPQENRDKYIWALEEFDLPISTGECETLLEQISSSDMVAGCASMAMVVGLIAGKRVVSCIPPGGKAIPLPHQGIENFEDLIR